MRIGWVAEVQAVGNCNRPRSRASDISRRFHDGQKSTNVRMSKGLSCVSVDLERDSFRRSSRGKDGSIAIAKSQGGLGLDLLVVLLKDPSLARDIGIGQKG